eukprot:5884990-Amphidinium_carterae.2
MSVCGLAHRGCLPGASCSIDDKLHCSVVRRYVQCNGYNLSVLEDATDVDNGDAKDDFEWLIWLSKDTVASFQASTEVISLSQAILYLLLSIWLSLHASVAAHSYGVRLLTQFVRLPVPDKVFPCKLGTHEPNASEQEQAATCWLVTDLSRPSFSRCSIYHVYVCVCESVSTWIDHGLRGGMKTLSPLLQRETMNSDELFDQYTTFAQASLDNELATV